MNWRLGRLDGRPALPDKRKAVFVAPEWLGLLLFAALSLGAVAVLLLIRDVAAAIAARGAAEKSAAFRLSRLPLARDQASPRSFLGEFDQWFLRLVQETGYDWSPAVAVLFLMLFALVVGGALFLGTDAPAVGAIGAGIGLGAALILLMVVRGRRIRQVQEQLPAALDMLARAVRAGESLEQAIELVGAKSPEPLAAEFRRVGRQLGMGLSMTAAMRALVYRVRLIDVRIFTTTLAVHRRTGGNLASTLERLAGVIRERLTYRRQMRAATGAGRVSATMIAAAGPLLFAYLFFFQPEYVGGLLTDPIGRSLLILAVLLEVAGLIWIARLLHSE